MKLILINDKAYRIKDKDYVKMERLMDESGGDDGYWEYFNFAREIEKKYKRVFWADQIFLI